MKYFILLWIEIKLKRQSIFSIINLILILHLFFFFLFFHFHIFNFFFPSNPSTSLKRIKACNLISSYYMLVFFLKISFHFLVKDDDADMASDRRSCDRNEEWKKNQKWSENNVKLISFSTLNLIFIPWWWNQSSANIISQVFFLFLFYLLIKKCWTRHNQMVKKILAHDYVVVFV